jgi:hypothetical protein
MRVRYQDGQALEVPFLRSGLLVGHVQNLIELDVAAVDLEFPLHALHYLRILEIEALSERLLWECSDRLAGPFVNV